MSRTYLNSLSNAVTVLLSWVYSVFAQHSTATAAVQVRVITNGGSSEHVYFQLRAFNLASVTALVHLQHLNVQPRLCEGAVRGLLKALKLLKNLKSSI